jgi:hypothetical protein
VSFHTVKDDFLLGHTGTKAKANAIALRTELVKKRKVDKVTIAETWTPFKMQCEMNNWWDYLRHEIDVSKVLDADFNFPKIHWMSHWVKQIRRSGGLQQNSADSHIPADKTNLTDGCNTSNHDLNYLPQVITVQRRILCFDV